MYFKTYPTFDVLGTQFGIGRSKANKNRDKLAPILMNTLGRLGVMPQREFASADEMKAAFQGIDRILIDVTERLYRRSQDDDTQREHYSGKKSTTPSKTPYIYCREDDFVSWTDLHRPNHDYSMLKEEFPPEQDRFVDLDVLVDLAYLGMPKVYPGMHVQLPHKKPARARKTLRHT